MDKKEYIMTNCLNQMTGEPIKENGKDIEIYFISLLQAKENQSKRWSWNYVLARWNKI